MPQPTVYSPAPSCAECGLEAAGRCPTCHRSLCVDHFGLPDHRPCADRLAAHGAEYVCYVCGIQVRPQQWSTAVFAHYIDSCACAGCHRYICEDQHTRRKLENVELVRDGLRSSRYHRTRRYCALCSPLRGVGGLIGASRWATGMCAAGLTAFFLLHR